MQCLSVSSAGSKAFAFGGDRVTIGLRINRLLRDNRASTMPLAAVALVLMVVLVGSGLDLSVAYMARAKLQNACDAATLAGRQSMEGNLWTTASENEAKKFFDFNYPAGTHGSTSISFTVAPNPSDAAELIGNASARVPTSLMRVFNYRDIPVAVHCDAKRDLGHNDIALVLDVTGSMNDAPSTGGSSKISRLRTGALSLYSALDDEPSSITRYAIIPYSHTVNVARSLGNKDILREQDYVDMVTTCSGWGGCYTTASTKLVHINNSSWNMNPGNTGGNTEAFRTSGNGCIEERPSIGRSASPVAYDDSITASDVDQQAGNAGNDQELQFGRYDPAIQEGESQSGCPAESTKLQTYSTLSAYTTAINSATARVTGGTYHDIGMLWGLRFISRAGYFSADNPTERSGVPIRQHIVFMTDGKLDTGSRLYSAFGVEQYQLRLNGSGTQNDRHIARFLSACNVAKAKGITVWVIALDVTDTTDISRCATTSSHFFTSDGSDLANVFTAIGQGIGNLRLTR